MFYFFHELMTKFFSPGLDCQLTYTMELQKKQPP